MSRRRSKPRRRQNRRPYHHLFRTTAEGIVYQDAGGHIIDANEAAQRILGLTLAQMQGRTSADPRWRAVREDGSDFPAEQHPAMVSLRTRRDAQAILGVFNPIVEEYRWLDVHAVAYAPRSGAAPTEVYTTFVDITEQRRTLAALRELERRTHQTFEEAPLGLVEADLSGYIIRANRAYREMLGATPEQLVGTHFTQWSRAPDGPNPVPGEGPIFSDMPPRHERLYRRVDGTTVWGESAVSIAYVDGRPQHLVSAVKDISRRKAAEDARAEAEQLLRSVLDSVAVVLFALDADGRFTVVAGGAKGPGEPVLPGQSSYAEFGAAPVRLPSGDRIDGREAIRRAMDGAEVTGTVEWERRQYMVRLLPRRDASGAPAGATGVAVDVTDQKRLEAQFLHSQKMEAVGRLAGGIAHDFNNLLTVIIGSVEILRIDLPDGAAPKALDSIDLAAEQAARLTRQLLTFSRQQVLDPEVLDVSTMVGELEDMIRRLVGEDVRVDVRLASDLPAVQLDRSQFEQVLLNLVVNARDAMPHGGSLRIETGYVARGAAVADGECGGRAGCVSLEVSDTGCGMPPEVVDRIFEPFFTTKGDAGTGLGLSTTYGIVKQSGGSLSVASIVAQGTTFTIWLPTVEASAAAPPARDPRTDSPAGSGRVLLVEDDAQVSALMALALRRAGYETVVASNGHEALEILDVGAAAIDLVLTDVVMSECDGRTLGREVGRRFPRLPVVYMSGYADQRVAPDDPRWTERVCFLQKPFSPSRLLETVREGIGR